MGPGPTLLFGSLKLAFIYLIVGPKTNQSMFGAPPDRWLYSGLIFHLVDFLGLQTLERTVLKGN